ncbi:hypothetical protein BY996DRAFT_936226 [Phakopsora pachyrhizi]|nr:hypothetical protein BY996DRAFT_936226 [Phakopsora pachyrhizi]
MIQHLRDLQRLRSGGPVLRLRTFKVSMVCLFNTSILPFFISFCKSLRITVFLLHFIFTESANVILDQYLLSSSSFINQCALKVSICFIFLKFSLSSIPFPIFVHSFLFLFCIQKKKKRLLRLS